MGCLGRVVNKYGLPRPRGQQVVLSKKARWEAAECGPFVPTPRSPRTRGRNFWDYKKACPGNGAYAPVAVTRSVKENGDIS